MSDIDIEKMTKEEALTYMGLPQDANDFAVDERFWQLSKKYRGKKDPDSEDKLNELSAVYNIACGRRDEAVAKAEKRAGEKKFLGKTKDEWKTYISYTWFKALIIVVVVAVAISVIYNAVFKNRYDSAAVAFGHFSIDSVQVEEKLLSEEIKNPYIANVDIVVPNEMGQTENIYSDQSLAAVMSMDPNVLITDSMTYKYYFSNFSDMTSIYNDLKLVLPANVYSKIVPIYLSERDAFLFTRDYLKQQDLLDGSTNVNEYDSTPVMIGLMITDKTAIASLGIENGWPDQDPEIIFGVYSNTADYSKAEKMILELFQNMSFS